MVREGEGGWGTVREGEGEGDGEHSTSVDERGTEHSGGVEAL